MYTNRVDPSGNIFATKARGTFIGNRGVIHNHDQQITRPFRLKAWITCVLQFKGRHREIMQPGRWTELFFLDEVTAFSAGHRPCAECRREAFNHFKKCWLKGNPEYGFDEKTSIKEIDAIIHAQRIDKDGRKVIFQMPADKLVDGVFILYDDAPHLYKNQQLHKWMPGGYEKPVALPDEKLLDVLTPSSIVEAFRAGL